MSIPALLTPGISAHRTNLSDVDSTSTRGVA
jgi:hypothetical protein